MFLAEALPLVPTLDSVIEKVGSRRTITTSGCWEFTGGHSVKGYPVLPIIWKGGRGGRSLAAKLHRLACARAMNLDYYGEWVTRHTCNNPGCWNPEHLIPGTNADNLRDMGKTLVQDHHDTVVHMRATGSTLKQIAEAIGVKHPAISKYLRKVGQ